MSLRILLLLSLALVTRVFALDVSILDFQRKPNALKKVSKEEAEFLTEGIRKVAAQQSGWRILSRETIQKILEENGKDYAECLANAEGKCEVAIGEILQAKYHVVGDISMVGAKIAVAVRLYDVKESRLVASEALRAASVDAAADQVEGMASKLFASVAGGKSDGGANAVVTATVSASPTNEGGLVSATSGSVAKTDLKPGMVSIPAGCFQMGSNDGYNFEKPVHQICLDVFSMDATEVTQGAYRSVMKTNPSKFSSCGDNCPVENVNWTEAKSYCERVGKRLPTEAEWEYAARAGTTTKWYWGDDENRAGDFAWYDGNSGSKTHPVGQKRPNAWGLYDMSGNVWEWVSDWYDAYPSGVQSNLTGPASGSYRVNRGGSWDYGLARLRSAGRGRSRQGDRVDFLGFRCVGP